jgi:hypothetical protein
MSDGAGTSERAQLLTTSSAGGVGAFAYHACDMEDGGRRKHDMRRLVAATGVLTIVVTSGCGGSSGSPQGSSADATTGARINLQQLDFPAGWQARPNPVAAPTNTQAERALYACLGSPPPESHTTADVNSPTFVQSSQQASSNVKFTRTAAQSRADYGTLATTAAADCTRKVLLNTVPKALGAGSSVASSSVSIVPTTAPPGDQVAATLVGVDVDVQGGRTTVYASFTTILRGRVLIAVQTIGLGAVFPADLQQTIVSDVERRADRVPA